MTSPAPSEARFSRMHPVLLRSLSAAVLIPVTLFDVWVGGVAFAAFVLLIGIAATREWSRMAFANRARTEQYISCGLAVAATAIGMHFDVVLPALAAVFAFWAVGLALSARHGGRDLRHAVFGVPYLCLPVAALIGLRAEETYGVLCIFWILIVIWITDTGAFFGGRAMGGPKLAPAVSPDKTWSGALTGVATAFVAGATYAWAVDLPAPMIIGLVSIAVSISGQLGDLLESGLKRRFNVKDSGTLIPGHGGVLDRIDSLVTAVTFVWVLGALRAGYDSAASGALVW